MAATQLIKIATRVGTVAFREFNNGSRYGAKVLRSPLPRIRVRRNKEGGWMAFPIGVAKAKPVEHKNPGGAFKLAANAFWA